MKTFARSLVSLTLFTLAFAAIDWSGSTEARAQGPFGPGIYSGYGYPPSYGGLQIGGLQVGGLRVQAYRGDRSPLRYSGPIYSGPIYHAPSVHVDQVYHPEYSHWTPGRGLHTHGHYHAVPHYTPGHFDHQHGGHAHGNPHFHH